MMASDDMRIRIITATLELAADHPVLSLSFSDIAARAGSSLTDLRTRYGSRIAILEDFAAYIDEQMLAGGDVEAAEPARERLLDVMMRRFDALAPYRPGLKGIRKAAMRDPFFAATLNHIAVGSLRWTLAAAGLDPSGPFAPMRRLARAEALVLVTANVLPVFLEDAEPDLPKTMAALDTALNRLDRVATAVTRMEAMVDRICSKAPRWKRRDADAGGPDNGPAAPSGGSPRPSGVFTRDDEVDVSAMTSGAGVQSGSTAAAGAEPNVDAVVASGDVAPTKPKAKRKPAAAS